MATEPAITVFYEVTADSDIRPFSDKFKDRKQAEWLKEKWMKTPEFFNIALWEVTITRKIL